LHLADIAASVSHEFLSEFAERLVYADAAECLGAVVNA